MLPLIRKSHFIPGIEIYQPMFELSPNDVLDIYNNDYVRENCLNFEEGIGKAFVYNIESKTLEEMDRISIYDAQSKYMYQLDELIVNQTLMYQNELLKMENASYKNIPKEEKSEWDNKRKAAIMYNDFLCELNKKGANMNLEEFKKKYTTL
jgi:hypothetical protein